MRKMWLVLIVAFGAGQWLPMAAAESFLEGFEDPNVYPIGWNLRDTDPWWGQELTKSPTILASVGVNSTVGLSASQRNFHWVAHPFDWDDPTVEGVIFGMDFRTPAATNTNFPFNGDEVGWTINEFSTSTDEYLQVSMSANSSVIPPVGIIKGKWSNTGGTGRDVTIVTYDRSLIQEYSWYRLRAQFTKLTDTSAQIDVTLTALNVDGSEGSVIATGTMPDTSALADPKDLPAENLFTSIDKWPTFRSYSEKASGPSDNCYFEIVRVPPPPCASKVTPEADQYAEADIEQTANPPSIVYTLENLGTDSYNYTVTELDDAQQPADIPWLSTDKALGTVPTSGTDTVTASINTAGIAGGLHTAHLKFTDSCDPAVEHIRRIDLAVYGCRWNVDSCSQERAYSLGYPANLPENVVYRISNTGSYPMDYTITKTGDSSCFEWLQLTQTAGTINAGQYVDIVCSIDVAQMVGHATDDDYTCTLTFSDNCSPQVVTRDVRLRYLAATDNQVFLYQGDIDPDTDDSAGPGCKFVPDRSDPNGSVETDFQATNGKVWRMVDSNGTIDSWYRAQYYKDGSAWDNMDIFGEMGQTMVARMRVRSSSTADRKPFLGIAEKHSSSALLHWGGPDGVIDETKRGVLEQTGVGSDGFFIFWIATKGSQDTAGWDCGRVVNLYMMNDSLQILWQKEMVLPSAKSESYEGFFFGDTSASGTMDVSYDWISGTNAGAFAPGEEVAVLGQSLIPAGCAVPWPDADEDDDVDMDDFAMLQRCFSPVNDPIDQTECRCFDRGGDGHVDENDVEAFVACATGAGVTFDKNNPPPGCLP